MSYKEKIKPLFFLFSLFFTGFFFTSNAFAIEEWVKESPYDQVHITSLYYNSSNELTVGFTFVPSGTYNQGLILPQTQYGTSISYSGNSSAISFGKWLCDGGEEYYFSSMVYLIRESDGQVLCKPTAIERTWWQNVYYGDTISNSTGLTKSNIDGALGTNFAETYFLIPTNSSVVSDQIYIWGSDNYPTVLNCASIGGGSFATSGDFPFQYLSIVNGQCGLDNGQTLSNSPPTPPLTLCQSGTATDVLYDNYSWFWSCEGSGGGTTDYCIAYETFVPATCGADNGQTVSVVDDFCSYGDLIVPSFVETITGWTWTCQRDTTYDYCSATRSEAPPTPPETEDCSTLSLPDKWFCQISNAVRGAFLPSSDKLNDLNVIINQIGERFPFNYVETAKYHIETISIATELPTIVLLGNSGTLNIDAVEDFADNVRNATTVLIALMFIFWLLIYIKHFF